MSKSYESTPGTVIIFFMLIESHANLADTYTFGL